MNERLSQCIANSVAWYQAVLRTHGLFGAIDKSVWTCRQPAPPYYSNAIIVDSADAAAQTEVLRDLARDVARPWSVKDSFAVLDLAPLGLHPLFDATWIWREPSLGAPADARLDVAWRRVIDEEELDRWEDAWQANGSPAPTRVFLPDLLTSDDVVLLAAHRGGRIVAGCAANRSGTVVGFSNFFAEDTDRDDLTASAVVETMKVAPGLPVVGYEWGEALDRAMRLGFEPVGPLRIWLAE
jgi:hypothetical protein